MTSGRDASRQLHAEVAGNSVFIQVTPRRGLETFSLHFFNKPSKSKILIFFQVDSYLFYQDIPSYLFFNYCLFNEAFQ
jgi:hypothetical protein